MNRIKKWTAVCVALVSMVFAGMPSAWADGTSVVIAAGKTSVAAGESFTVTVGFQSSRMAMVQMDIGYDGNVLTLTNTESVAATKVGSGNPFTVLYDSATGSKAETLVKLTFTVKSGTAAGTKALVRVTNAIDDNGASMNNASVTVTVAAPKPAASSKAPVSSKAPTTSKAPSSKPTTLSNNAKLKSLTIDGVSLNFSPTVTEYAVQVPAETTALTIQAEPAEKNAKITVTNPATLKTGMNYVIVKVTAPDGKTTKSYNIGVTRAAASVSEAPIASSDPPESQPPTSEPAEPETSAPASAPTSVEPPSSSDASAAEPTSSAEPERPNAFLTWLRADHSRWAIHAAYIGGMIVCLLVGCALGYFIRGRRDSES